VGSESCSEADPLLHPDLIPIVERAESLGASIEMNTNCSTP
jgi:hypothetical protein